MSSRHSQVHRGMSNSIAPAHEARFGRLFSPHVAPPASFGASDQEQSDNLAALAERMVAGFDAPKDGPDGEESGIPSLYTYFGQFVDHDLTFDASADGQKQRDPGATIDFRSPAFDLDNIYGRGPGDQPYLYDEDGKSLLMGDAITQGTPRGRHSPGARDLQRNGAGRALIGDPRNDENAIVSQLQGLFIQYHNRLVAEHQHLGFDAIQAMVRAHYQHVVLEDFLPRIVKAEVLATLKGADGKYDPAKLKFYDLSATPYMPIEFAAAAYRFGHSMVRPGYRLNDSVLLPIFPLPASVAPGFPEGLTGFRRLISDWSLDWGRFIDIDVRDFGVDEPTSDAERASNFRRLQLAYRIDTSLVDPLRNLPAAVAGDPPPSLAERNLKRGLQFGLPSGQAVAAAMGLTPLADALIGIGKALDAFGPDDPAPTPIADIKAVFAGNCPLWAYCLAEAMQPPLAAAPAPVNPNQTINTAQLGPVGGGIVAEVFVGLMAADPLSILNGGAHLRPRGDFKLKDLVTFALGL